jgi:hypothetical protein
MYVDNRLVTVHEETVICIASMHCTVNTHGTARWVVPEISVPDADDDDAHGLPGRLHQRRLF